MTDNIISVSIIAIIPTLFLCGYIYYKDRVEKEPANLLFALFSVGAVCFIPSYYLSKLLSELLDKVFAESITYSAEGIIGFSDNSQMYLHNALYSFACVALVRELLKWLVLVFMTRKNKNFNCLFDGIVYSVFVSLGFGIVENIRYAFVDGWDSLLIRLVSLAPGYFFYGVIMGVFYTFWFAHKKAGDYEKQLINDGKTNVCCVKSSSLWLLLSLLLPTVVHGLSLFSSMGGNKVIEIASWVLVLLLYVVCFLVTRWFSKHDTSIDSVSKKIVIKKHKYSDEVIDEVDYGA